MSVKRLIVNADDLGYDPEIDRGILEAHTRGIVTSATAMVDTPFAEAALKAAPASLAIGLHAVLDPRLPTAQAVDELRRQIDRFERLRGEPPTHLDSHKHSHAQTAILAAYAQVAAYRDLPARAIDAEMRRFLRDRGVRTTDHFLGDADLRPCWTLERLLGALATLPEGTAELMCHPGYLPARARTSFAAEREIELRALCDPRAKQALAATGAALATYRDS